MSWFTDIAGRAEGFLNQIDQSAANVLQKPTNQNKAGGGGGSPKHHLRHHSEVNVGGQLLPEVGRPGTSVSYGGESKDSGIGLVQQSKQRSGYASSVSSFQANKASALKDEEEKLIDYLNDPANNKPTFGAGGLGATPISRRSSNSSLRSLPVLFHSQLQNTFDYDLPIVSSANQGAAPSEQKKLVTHSESKKITAALGGTAAADPSAYATVAAATASGTGTGFGGISRELQELRARETDFQKALQSKDSQLAVLRVRLQDADQQLQLKSQRLYKLEQEQERLIKDSAESSSYKADAFDSLEKQLKEAELDLERERNNTKRIENEFLARIQRLEHEQSDVLQQLTSVQKSLTDEKIRCRDFAEQLKLAKYNLESNKLEFDEYKQKAQRILQSKEKLIATLKSDESGNSAQSENTNLLIQLEELKTERDLLKEDLQQAHLQLYNLRGETQELETQLASEQRSALEQQRHLQDQCQTYQQSAAQYREQYEQLKQDYQYVQDEMRRQHVLLQTKLREKDAEIARLITQVTNRPFRETNESESEIRVRQLTENLIQKQTVIEALQTDKQTLSLQVERMEKMYREAESAAIRASSSTMIDIGNMDEGVHSRIPSFLKETPFDTKVTRGVKKAYSNVEKLSVKFGLFVRRYPTARLFILIYAMLLHVWVLIVLLTYTPEIHSSDYQPAETNAALARHNNV